VFLSARKLVPERREEADPVFFSARKMMPADPDFLSCDLGARHMTEKKPSHVKQPSFDNRQTKFEDYVKYIKEKNTESTRVNKLVLNEGLCA